MTLSEKYLQRLYKKNGNLIAVSAFSLVSVFLGFVSYLIEKKEIFGFSSIIIFFMSGVAITGIARRKKLVTSFSKWMYGLIAYTITSYIVFVWFWYFPLASLGDLRTATQIPEYQDANYYDYLAYLASVANYSDWLPILSATWLSQGVVAYLGVIYKYFGTSQFNFVFINILLGYLSVIYIQGIVSTPGRKDVAIPALFIPFVLYYNVTPGKEVLTNVLSYATLYFIFLAWNRRGRIDIGLIIVILMHIIILALIRVNAALMIIGVFAIYCFVHAENIIKLIFGFSLFGLAALYAFQLIGLSDLFLLIADMDVHMSQLDLRLRNSEVGGLKYTLATTLTSDNYIVNIILAPFRMIIWLVAPFPFVNLDGLLQSIFSSDHYTIFRAGEGLARSFSSLIMVCFCFKVIRFLAMYRHRTASSSVNFLLFMALGFTLILSTTNFVEGARYRTIIEPLAICWMLMVRRRNMAFFSSQS